MSSHSLEEDSFPDASIYFSEDEWSLLHTWQKELYRNVMHEIHQALISLGPLIVNTVFSLRAKEKQELWHSDPQESQRSHDIDISKCISGTSPEESFRIIKEEPFPLNNTHGEERNNYFNTDDAPIATFINQLGEQVEESSTDPISGHEIISFPIKAETETYGPTDRQKSKSMKRTSTTAGYVTVCPYGSAAMATSGDPPPLPPSPGHPEDTEGTKDKKPNFEHEELRILIDGLNRHAAVLFANKQKKILPRIKNQLWDEVAEEVSAVGVHVRTEADCKKKWQDLKVKVRRAVRDHQKASQLTRGGTLKPLRLHPWEKICLALMDKAALEGVGAVELSRAPSGDQPGPSGYIAPRQARKRRAVSPIPAPEDQESAQQPPEEIAGPSPPGPSGHMAPVEQPAGLLPAPAPAPPAPPTTGTGTSTTSPTGTGACH